MNHDDSHEKLAKGTSESLDDRREFLKKCGRFGVITPPAIMMLLSTSLSSPALAYSSGGGGKVKGWQKFGKAKGWGQFGKGKGWGRVANLAKRRGW